KTHPLLAPLVPRIRDMLEEYRIASNGQVVVEIIDPLQNPELEAEANQTYGIQPTPMQSAGRYEASVVNAYFDILIRYGDQTIVLNFQDLAEFNLLPDGTYDIQLRNLEYDLTRSIKKVVYGFQSIDSVLAALPQPVQLILYITPDALPDWLVETMQNTQKVAGEIANTSNGKLTFDVINVDDPNSPVSRQDLVDQYSLQAFPVDFFGTQTYYAHMLLVNGDQGHVIYPSGEQTEAEVRSMIETSLKRTSTGFLKVAGLWTPPTDPLSDPVLGEVMQPLSSYQALADQLAQEYTLRAVDLATGQVPTDIDVLVVVEPVDLTNVELYAIDQYLMRGGSVVLAANNYRLVYDSYQGMLALTPITGGVQDLLAHYGVDVPDELVLDTQNSPFPLPIVRTVGGSQVQEFQAIDYPLLIDVRPDGMSDTSPIVSNLAAATLSFASPVLLDEAKNAGRETAVLLQSSDNSWTTTISEINPDYDLYPNIGFPLSPEQHPYPLAVSVQGAFDSYFAGQPNPIQAAAEAVGATPPTTQPTIEHSAGSARLIVIGSPVFMEDNVSNLMAQISGDLYLNNLQLMQNSVDWAVEDLDLLAIRSRGNASHVLQPLDAQEQSFWEVANYVVALAALVGVYFAWRTRRRSEQPMTIINNE
ncbi:MAG: Gldg family protein, partial [Anaerolineales bacterium]|nr:Gldg family protein [Anaerolineales bacterium]